MPLFGKKSSETLDDGAKKGSRQEPPSLLRRLSSRKGSKAIHSETPTPSAPEILHSDSGEQSKEHGHRTREDHDSRPRHHSHSRSRDRQPSSSRPTSREAKSVGGSADDSEPDPSALSRDDIHTLFAGAPHFMLEKGRRGRYFPQAFFPFNSPLDITDLQDRQYLKHESFALATMHAHLPIPDEVDWRPGKEHPKPRESFETGKRPMFDLGIYERPNMLGIGSVEPGAWAFRSFLERRVADGLVDEKKEHAEGTPNQPLEHVSASETFKMLAHDEGTVHIGKQAPRQDRLKLLKGGPKGWKRIGVRNISVPMITERLQLISGLRDEIVNKGWHFTILDQYSAADLGNYLFNHLLYPPNEILGGHSGQGDLKVQIEALVKVLTTPGAWLDFSLPAQRFLFVQNINTVEAIHEDKHGVNAAEKRKYSLVQLLLAVELVVRLDAALRLGVAQHGKGLEVSPSEIHHFNKLRNLKADWDFIVARRFLDLTYAKSLSSNTSPPSGKTPGSPTSPPQSPGAMGSSTRTFSHSLLHPFKHDTSDQSTVKSEEDTLVILPRQPESMVTGLLRFATDIKWPSTAMDYIKRNLEAKIIHVSLEQREVILGRGVETVAHPHAPQSEVDRGAVNVELRAASKDTIGGPLSHCWLGGFIIPGYMSCDLLMCTLLENDPEALQALGNLAWPRAGFILNGRSWWSKIGAVAGIVAPVKDAGERMGWVALPEKGLDIFDGSGDKMTNGWVVLRAEQSKKRRVGERIFDGDALAKESAILGVGKGKVRAAEFRMVTDSVFEGEREADVEGLSLILEKIQAEDKTVQEKEIDAPLYKASLICDVLAKKTTEEGHWARNAIQLKYNVRFIGGHPCRPPHGHTQHHERGHEKLKHKEFEYLPAHPLHQSYNFTTMSMVDVLELGEKDGLPNPCDKEANGPVWIVDARGGWEREVVVRAWCAKVGMHAVVSRIGRSCLGCAVREAKALEVGIVIRIGGGKECKTETAG